MDIIHVHAENISLEISEISPLNFPLKYDASILIIQCIDAALC